MRNIELKFAAALCLVCAPVLPAGGTGQEPGKGLSSAIAAYANANGVNKLVVAGFTAEGGAENRDADYISGIITGELSGYKSPALIDRDFFGNVLRAARASAAAGGSPEAKTYRELLSVDAAVIGTVRASGGKLKIAARLVDLKTGRVLFSAGGEAAREPGGPAAPAEALTARRRSGIYYLTPELPGILVPAGVELVETAALPTIPADLRDAVSEPRNKTAPAAENSCAGRKLRLAQLNSELVDAKARYWSDRLKSPGGGPGLGENPGSEIEAPAVKALFYRLLAGYYKAGAAALPEPLKIAEVRRLLEMEKKFSDDCEYQEAPARL